MYTCITNQKGVWILRFHITNQPLMLNLGNQLIMGSKASLHMQGEDVYNDSSHTFS